MSKRSNYIAKNTERCYNTVMDINFVKELQYGQAHFRYSRGPSLRKGHEIHSHHEIIYYIDGDATFISGDSSTELRANTLIFVPKGCFHNFKIKHQEKYMRLTVSFPSLPILDEVLESVDGIVITRATDVIKYAEAMIKSISDDSYAARSLSVFASFLSLISELTRVGNDHVASTGKMGTVSQCIAFIDEHFAESISVSELAKRYYVSKSFLFSEFKRSFGISIHQYITQRRMVYAKRLLDEGKRPTEVYSLCGYSDYSTFYKAYIKRFSESPRSSQRDVDTKQSVNKR